jgi:hypothetical protein
MNISYITSMRQTTAEGEKKACVDSMHSAKLAIEIPKVREK